LIKDERLDKAFVKIGHKQVSMTLGMMRKANEISLPCPTIQSMSNNIKLVNKNTWNMIKV
jgi:hypothetical protein